MRNRGGNFSVPDKNADNETRKTSMSGGIAAAEQEVAAAAKQEDAAAAELEVAAAEQEVAAAEKEYYRTEDGSFPRMMAQKNWETAQKSLERAEKSLERAESMEMVSGAVSELQGAQNYLALCQEAAGRAILSRQDRMEQLFDEGIERRIAQQVLMQFVRFKMEHPRRELSLLSKSDAWNLMLQEDRVCQGRDFFFALKELPKNFTTTAFKETAMSVNDDENKFHHPYFLRQVGRLVADARSYGMEFQQQLLWTNHGKWLTLDDSPTNGVEPDFSMMRLDSSDRYVSTEEEGVKTPSSKYDVSLCFEQKKKFGTLELMEAIDYGQRLLRVQCERKYAITALFHCTGEEKIIRWVQAEVGDDGNFTAKVTRPFDLSPGGVGQQQLLTLLSMSPTEIGLDRPSVEPIETSEVCEIRYWIGWGATSRVYSAIWRERQGVIKILSSYFVHLVDHEVGILSTLASAGVVGIPRAEKIADNTIFFEELLIPMEYCGRSFVEELVSCLQGAHKSNIIHRDVRPENVMKNAEGRAILNDWGCSSIQGASVSFAGTFRYASEEVLESAIQGEDRAPQPKDDLHSLVRTVLALNDVDLRRKLSNIADRDFEGAKEFWKGWRQVNGSHEQFFTAAENLDYSLLHQVR